MDIEKYWNSKILEWEDSMVGGNNVSVIERVASNFRQPLIFRSNLCLNLISPYVKGRHVLELGCGSGYFAFKLFEEHNPAKITGIDISGAAIKRASEKAFNLYGGDNIFDFKVEDISNTDLPEAHITIGLGLLDYLSQEEIKTLFSRMKSDYFLFTFPERVMSIYRFMHIIYMKNQRCPKHFYYTKSEIRDCCRDRYPQIEFVNHSKLSFGCIVHNLPSPK